MRVGALYSIKVTDLEKVQDLYKFTAYRGDKEQYITFCTPECCKEIDAYLDFRKRRGENITGDLFLLIKRFSKYLKNFKSETFTSISLRALLSRTVENSGLRQIDSKNRYRRREIPILHGFRKFFTKHLVD